MIRNCLILLLAAASSAPAHDTWVETNTNLIRSGDAVYVDLKLGNHGNNHRDFKLASKVGLQDCTLNVLSPDGKSYDLKTELFDTGYAPKEGYWTAKFVPAHPGLYMIAHQLDRVVSYAPVRSIKSAKTFFVVSPSLDRVSTKNLGFDQVLGHSLEIVPLTSPVTPMGPGQPITVQLIYNGKPMANARVSFIPHGHQLKKDYDPDYERKTDIEGQATFTPRDGNAYLVVAHHKEPDEAGKNYESTKYSATLTVLVPEICPCCGE